MFKRFCALVILAGGLPLAAQLSSALPADRLAFANQLAKRGLHAEAMREYEELRKAQGIPGDEVLYRLAEAYRALKRGAEALAVYDELLKKHPDSRYVDYARLNRALLLEGPARLAELRELDHAGAREPIRASALYYLGETAEQANEGRKAIDYYMRAAGVSRTNDVARLARLRAASLLSVSSLAADRRQAQLIYLDLAASGEPSLVEESLFFSGMLSYREGRYAEAAALFRRLKSEHGGSARARECVVYDAWSHYLSGRYMEALKMSMPLREAGDEDGSYLVAASLRMLERRADARIAYDAYLKAFPRGRHFDTAWFERLSVIAHAGEPQAVLDELARHGDPPTNVAEQVWSYGCEAAIAVTNYALAVQYARLVAVNKESPRAPNAVHRLAWLLEKTGDWPRAARAYRSLSEYWPQGAVAAQALYQAGLAELKAGRPEQARADWSNLLANYPTSPFAPEALYSRAMQEIRTGEFRAANRSLDELATRFPKVPRRAEALYWWGVAAQGMDDSIEAERHFRDALAAEPSAEFRREVELELGTVLKRLGRESEAVPLFAGLLETKVVERMTPDLLAWLSESLLSMTNHVRALQAARTIAGRGLDPAWEQTAATLEGDAHLGLSERDAAVKAYERALKAEAKTHFGARAALELGRIETALGMFDEAKSHLGEAVERTQSTNLLSLRVQAYVALATNEEERGDAAAALGYHLLVGTLFDDPVVVPRALRRAAAILRSQGKAKEADALIEELAKRYPSVK